MQVEYRGGRITTKQQSHPDITLGSAMVTHGPQSVASTGKKAPHQHLLKHLERRHGSKTQRPVQSAQQNGRAIRNQSAIMSQNPTVKQQKGLGALDEIQQIELQEQQLSASALNQIVSTTAENQTLHQRLASESGGSEMLLKHSSLNPGAGAAATLHADGTTAYNLATTAYASNTMSVNMDGRRQQTGYRQTQRVGLDSPQHLDENSMKHLSEAQLSSNRVQMPAGASNLLSPAAVSQPAAALLLSSVNRASEGIVDAVAAYASGGGSHWQADGFVPDQNPVPSGGNRPLLPSSMGASGFNEVIKEEHHTESHQASISARRTTEEAYAREQMQVATGVVDIEANLQEIKQRGLSSLQTSHAFESNQGNSGLARMQLPQSVQPQFESGQHTQQITVSTIDEPQREYLDIEDFNTSYP